MADIPTLPSAQTDRVEKKTQIARAAVKVFAESGIARAKMIDVARAAGVGKGTIYEYFRSKDDLFEYAVKHFFESISEDLTVALSLETDPARQLETLIRTTFESIRKAGPEAHIMLEIWAEGVRSGVDYFDLAAMYSDYRTLIAGIITAGIEKGQFRAVDPLLTGASIIAALDGLLLQWILLEDAFDLGDVAGQLIDLTMNGLAIDHT